MPLLRFNSRIIITQPASYVLGVFEMRYAVRKSNIIYTYLTVAKVVSHELSRALVETAADEEARR